MEKKKRVKLTIDSSRLPCLAVHFFAFPFVRPTHRFIHSFIIDAPQKDMNPYPPHWLALHLRRELLKRLDARVSFCGAALALNYQSEVALLGSQANAKAGRVCAHSLAQWSCIVCGRRRARHSASACVRDDPGCRWARHHASADGWQMTRGQLILTRHYASNVITRQLRVNYATSIADSRDGLSPRY